MNLKEIKNKLDSTEYDFLRTNEHLKNNIMLLTLGGSYAYGTNIKSSDLDIRGIFASRLEELLGISKYEEFENKATDTVIHSFDKIIQLMINANPNVLEIFGTKNEHVFILSEEGKMLKDNVNLFLSRKVIHSFSGYSFQQLRRLQNALCHDSYTQPQKETHILNSIKLGMESVKDNYRSLNNGFINLYLDKSNKDDYDTEIFMDVELKHYPMRDFKSIYSDMTNVIKDYDKLNHRNKKKDEEHLSKHAMHLIRLTLTCIEILTTGVIRTYRENDISLLMDIRNGKYTYDEIFEMNNNLEKDFQYAKDNSLLPDQPDYKKIEELVIEIKKKLLKKYKI